EELAGIHLRTHLVEHGGHHLRLDGEDDRLRAPHELAVVARDLDLVGPLETPQLCVDGVAHPEVAGAVLTRVEQSADEGARHVTGADEADLLHEPSRHVPRPRGPKSARPSLSRVAPSSTATAKSSVIPIDRWGSSTPRRDATWSRRARRAWKWGRDAWLSAVRGGIAMSPWRQRAGRDRTCKARPSTAPGARPRFCGSPATFTWMRTISRRPARVASASSAAARGSESTVWTQSKVATAARTLLRCRPPIRCHVAVPPAAARLALASCT